MTAMIGTIILALALMQSLSTAMDYHAIVRVLYAIPFWHLACAVAATLVSYLAILGRDATILRYIEARIRTPVLIVGAVCSSALGNIVGFGPLSGCAVRYRVYAAMGVGGEQVARLTAWITLGIGAGVAMFAALDAMFSAKAVAAMLMVSRMGLQMGCVAVLSLGAAAVALCRRDRTMLRVGRICVTWPSRGFLLGQFALIALKLLSAGLALWILLPAGKPGFLPFMAIFSLATGLGGLSHVPGGLGVFDTAIVFLAGQDISSSHAVAALVGYRLIYFLLPLLLSAGLLAGFELRRVPAHMASPAMLRFRRGIGQLAPPVLGVTTFSIGVLLLLSGATPAFSHRLATLAMTLPLWAVESSQFLESLLGVLLLFIARGLSGRLDGAWWMALGVASVSLVLSLVKGLAFGEAGLLLCLILLLLATRRQFNRPAWFLRETFTPGWFLAIAVVIAITFGMLFFAFRNVAYCHDLWWKFAFDAKAPRALRATVGAAILAGGIAMWQLLRLAPGRVRLPSLADLEAAAAIVRGQGRSDAMLALMGDKSLLFSETGTAFLMYAKRGRSWIALHDPVGDPAEAPALIQRFIALAHSHGGRAAFYQVRPETLSLYLDAGLHLVKLGEEALIDLDSFSLAGPQRSNLRYARKRGARDGLSFALIPQAEVAAALPVLQGISDDWLRSRRAKEKGFSVAAFEPRYIEAQSVALVLQDGRPVGFATYMATDPGTEATIGVMRHVPEASGYAMEFLFTELALALQHRGCRRLSLGAVPLSGLARTPLSSPWHRMGGLVWQHGNALYDFQGLRRFKNKFAPRWEPRYMAASGTVGSFGVRGIRSEKGTTGVRPRPSRKPLPLGTSTGGRVETGR